MDQFQFKLDEPWQLPLMAVKKEKGKVSHSTIYLKFDPIFGLTATQTKFESKPGSIFEHELSEDFYKVAYWHCRANTEKPFSLFLAATADTAWGGNLNGVLFNERFLDVLYIRSGDEGQDTEIKGLSFTYGKDLNVFIDR